MGDIVGYLHIRRLKVDLTLKTDELKRIFPLTDQFSTGGSLEKNLITGP